MQKVRNHLAEVSARWFQIRNEVLENGLIVKRQCKQTSSTITYWTNTDCAPIVCQAVSKDQWCKASCTADLVLQGLTQNAWRRMLCLHSDWVGEGGLDGGGAKVADHQFKPRNSDVI